MAKKSYLTKMIDDIDAEIVTLEADTARYIATLHATRARLVKEREERAAAKKPKATA